MIKYNASNNVISPFNPMLALHPQIRRAVNEQFIKPILEVFFKDKKGADNKIGIENFEALDVDRLKTEKEFQHEENYVQNYIYAELIKEIQKNSNGKVIFKPRYSISFDWDLTYKWDTWEGQRAFSKNYPYKQIFKDSDKVERQIRYGTLRLGEAPILYIIFIEFSEFLKFIKTLSVIDEPTETKQKDSPEEKKQRLYDEVIRSKQRQLRETSDVTEQETVLQDLQRLTYLRDEPLQGTGGKLRVNLSWNTTDDLDLHIETPNGKIFYNNKVVEYQGVIGELDVDSNASGDLVSNPQENVNWDSMPVGQHKIFVHLYKSREKVKVTFTVTILNDDGDGRVYNNYIEFGTTAFKTIASFEFKDGELVFQDL